MPECSAARHNQLGLAVENYEFADCPEQQQAIHYGILSSGLVGVDR